MNVLDNFLENVTDENGNKVDFSNIENEGFIGIICLGSRSADIVIDIDSFSEIDNNLSDTEKTMLNVFVEYTQSQMRNQKLFIENIKNTQKQLYI